MKKSFFERVGLIETEPEEFENLMDISSLSPLDASPLDTPLDSSISEYSPLESQVLTISEERMTPNDIYSKCNLEESTSIFKVDELSKKLPDTLPSDVKRQSLLGIMEVTNLSIDALLSDAQKRTEALKSVLTEFSQKTSEIISANEAETDELLSKIQQLKEQTEQRKKLQEDQESLITEELGRIASITEFINPSHQDK